ncbi:MAG: thioredoxin domain-containing protein [Deltaproteobacteria bacterium]|nr:thioredoxin domain-containing protein [Deltaproteobacteria bacterium]
MQKTSALLIAIAAASVGCPRPTETKLAQGTSSAVAGPVVAQPTLAPRVPANTVVARWKGGELTYGELYDKGKSDIVRLYNKYLQDLEQAEREQLEGSITQRLVENAAKAKGVSEGDYVKSIPVPEVSEADVQSFFQANVAASGRSIEETGPRIREYLANQKRQGALQEHFNKLRSEAGVAIDLPAPPFITMNFDLANSPMKGDPNGKITIVEFSDFQCPYCSRGAQAIEQILGSFPKNVRIYFMNFPLNFHERAMPAAIAGRCAHRQGKFWPLHDRMFDNQSKLDDASIQEHASAIGLDTKSFTACLADPSVRQEVEADLKQGENVGVNGTPSFFVNGIPYPQGAPTPERLREMFPNDL